MLFLIINETNLLFLLNTKYFTAYNHGIWQVLACMSIEKVARNVSGKNRIYLNFHIESKQSKVCIRPNKQHFNKIISNSLS